MPASICFQRKLPFMLQLSAVGGENMIEIRTFARQCKGPVPHSITVTWHFEHRLLEHSSRNPLQTKLACSLILRKATKVGQIPVFQPYQSKGSIGFSKKTANFLANMSKSLTLMYFSRLVPLMK